MIYFHFFDADDGIALCTFFPNISANYECACKARGCRVDIRCEECALKWAVRGHLLGRGGSLFTSCRLLQISGSRKRDDVASGSQDINISIICHAASALLTAEVQFAMAHRPVNVFPPAFQGQGSHSLKLYLHTSKERSWLISLGL